MTGPATAPATVGRRRVGVYALVSAYFVSVGGTAMSALAIPWPVLTTTGSASRTGLVVFAEMTPYVVVQAISGPWVDRAGAHRSATWGNAAAAAAVGAIPVLQAANLLSIGALLGLVAAAVTFAAAAVLIGALVPVSAQPDTGGAEDARRVRYLGQLVEGLRFVRADRLILALATMIAVTNLPDCALFSVLLRVWVRDRLGAVGALGRIIGAGGAGSLLGNLLGAWLGPPLPAVGRTPSAS